MTCAACATRIETVLNKLPGVSANVNLATEQVRVRFDPWQASLEDLLGAVRKAGYDAHELTEASRQSEQLRLAQRYRHELWMFCFSALLTLPLLAEMIPMLTGSHAELLPRWLPWVVSGPLPNQVFRLHLRNPRDVGSFALLRAPTHIESRTCNGSKLACVSGALNRSTGYSAFPKVVIQRF